MEFEFKDFIQINKSDEFIEINVGPPYNKQLLKIPNFEVVELRTSFDDGFVEYFTRADDTALDLNGQSILAYGKPLERFGNLEGWSAVGSLNKAFSIEDRGDTILLKLTSPSSGKVFEIFDFQKDQLIGHDSITIDAGLGLEFDISGMFDRGTYNAYYQQNITLDLPSGDAIQETIDWGLENGMLDVYHLDTDSIVAPEDQLNYYLISNPNNASPWDPNSGLPPEQYQAPGLYYFTNDEGLNVVTSNPEDAPVMLSEFLTMTSGGAGDDILQAHNIEYEDFDFKLFCQSYTGFVWPRR